MKPIMTGESLTIAALRPTKPAEDGAQAAALRTLWPKTTLLRPNGIATVAPTD